MTKESLLGAVNRLHMSLAKMQQKNINPSKDEAVEITFALFAATTAMMLQTPAGRKSEVFECASKLVEEAIFTTEKLCGEVN